MRTSSIFLLAMTALPAFSATPDSATLTLDQTIVEYTAGPFAGANIAHQGDSGANGPTCASPVLECDEFALTVDLPEGLELVYPAALLRVQWGWEDLTGAGLSDFDCWVLTPEGDVVELSGVGSNNPEAAAMLAYGGITNYKLTCVPFSAIGESISAKVELVLGDPVETDESSEGRVGLASILAPEPEPEDSASARSAQTSSAGALGWLLLPLSFLAYRRRRNELSQ